MAALRIQEHLVPADHGDAGRRGRARGEPLRLHFGEEIERDIDRSGAGWDVAVEGVHVHAVPLPGQRLAPRRDPQPGQVRDRAGRAMLTRDPLGIEQGERSRGGRNDQMGVEDPARGFGSVHSQLDDREGFPRLGCGGRPVGESRQHASQHQRNGKDCQCLPPPDRTWQG